MFIGDPRNIKIWFNKVGIFEDREIKEGKTYVMKTGFQAAKRENWEEAKKDWEQLLNNKNSLVKIFLFKVL